MKLNLRPPKGSMLRHNVMHTYNFMYAVPNGVTVTHMWEKYVLLVLDPSSTSYSEQPIIGYTSCSL